MKQNGRVASRVSGKKLPETATPSQEECGSQSKRTLGILREMILRGSFRPGERLSELPLAARLGASRTPIRLALERLSQEGLLESIPGAGFKVKTYSITDIYDAIALRGVLEGMAARSICERISDPRELEPILNGSGGKAYVARTAHTRLAFGAQTEKQHQSRYSKRRVPAEKRLKPTNTSPVGVETTLPPEPSCFRLKNRDADPDQSESAVRFCLPPASRGPLRFARSVCSLLVVGGTISELRAVCQRLASELNRLERDHAEKLEALNQNRMAFVSDYRKFRQAERDARRLLENLQGQLHEHKRKH